MDHETQQKLVGMSQIVQDLGKRAQALEQQQRELAAEKMVEAVSKLVTTTYDKAVAYTNLILIAGYASFFALLGATKSLLHERTTVIAALLMAISVSSFILFEVYKMILHARFPLASPGFAT